jgi:hypothetical protein
MLKYAIPQKLNHFTGFLKIFGLIRANFFKQLLQNKISVRKGFLTDLSFD